MTEKELQDILDELHEVDIEHLNEKALRLFKAIMKIADQRDLYKQKLDEIENADLSIVYMSGFYDGEKKWKDKIKAKIEELNKEYEEYKDGQEWEIQDDIQAQISILEELLKGGGLKMNNENVNHPKHYNQGKYEVIEVIEDWKLGFNLGNVIKYVARSEYKGKPVEDLEKAKFYLEREINNRKVKE